jgi:hypothetical protein
VTETGLVAFWGWFVSAHFRSMPDAAVRLGYDLGRLRAQAAEYFGAEEAGAKGCGP